jgi:hypothetical protein
MESTGTRNRIHVSQGKHFGEFLKSVLQRSGSNIIRRVPQDTANALIEQGKGSWLKPREDSVFAKGKGEMQTYWVDFTRSASFVGDLRPGFFSKKNTKFVDRPNVKQERLIDWNTEVLKGLLKNVVAMRDPRPTNKKQRASRLHKSLKVDRGPDSTVLDEVCEIIKLPGNTAQYKQNPEEVELSAEVVSQLRDYVKSIAEMYRDNPFHNFEHAR